MSIYINGKEAGEMQTIELGVKRETKLMPLLVGTGTFTFKGNPELFPRMSTKLRRVFKIIRWNGKVFW